MKHMKPLRAALSRIKRQHLQRKVVAEQKGRVNHVFIHIPKCGGTSLTRAIGQRIKLHDTAAERHSKLGQARWDAVYSFSVVRHPMDRVVSFYKFHHKTAHGADRLVGMSLTDWVRAVLQDRSVWKGAITGRMAPCRSWLAHAGGDILVTETFQLERLSQAWPLIQQRTGIVGPLPHSNASGDGLGRGDLDAQSRQIIREVYAADFEEFGYDD